MSDGYGQIILFGDSLTQQSFAQDRGFGFGAALQNAYIRRVDVLNRGFSGYNTQQALKLLPEALPLDSKSKCLFATIWLGANDACLPESNTKQHVPVSQYKENLNQIIDEIRSRIVDPRKIILITPPPIDEYIREKHDTAIGVNQRQRTAEHTKLYADAVRELGKRKWVVTLDIWSIYMTRSGWKEGEILLGSKSRSQSGDLSKLMHDGLHLNPVAYQILFEELMKTIGENWPELMPEKLPFVFPEWELAPK